MQKPEYRSWKPSSTSSVSFRLKPISLEGSGEEGEIGCELELTGTHHAAGKHLVSGCPGCVEVLQTLLEVNDRILSGESARYHRAQSQKLISYASTTGDRPEVVLDLRITRRPAFQHVADEDWTAELVQEIRAELLNLGCSEVPFVQAPEEPFAFGTSSLAGAAV